MILTDNETRVDLLNNEAIAKTIIELLREKPERAVTIGVHGDWGAGKSSILEMIENGLSSDKDVLCIKFNGWRFQGFEDAKIALIEGIVTTPLPKNKASPRQPQRAASWHAVRPPTATQHSAQRLPIFHRCRALYRCP